MSSRQDRGVKEDELQSILNYLLTMHEVRASVSAREAQDVARQWQQLSGACTKCEVVCGPKSQPV